jgi:hypothetical protein
MGTLATLAVNLTLNSKDYQSGLDRAQASAEGWRSKVSGVFGNALSFAGGGLMVGALDAISGSVGSLADSMIGGNAAFEDYNTRYKVMLGSAEAAQQRMAELAEFGAKTPFELPGVVEADTILTGFGLTADNVREKWGFDAAQIRTIAGDVASGTGAEFEEMALLIGKFSSGATGEAISRMQELGITNREELTKMGLEFSKSGELLSPLPQSMETILGLMQQKYGGLMNAQSSTMNGMVSNLEDWKAGTLRTIGTPIFEVLKDKLGIVLEYLNRPETQATITQFATLLADKLGVAMEWLSNTGIPALIVAWNDFEPPIMTVLGWLGQLATFLGGDMNLVLGGLAIGLAVILGPIGALALAGAALYAAWKSDFGGIRTTLTDFWEGAQLVWGGFISIFTEKLPNAWDNLRGKWDEFIGWIKGQIASLPGAQWIIDRLSGTPPGRARGGPVNAGSPYTVGERGPEVFVPGVSGTIVPNGGGGGASIVVNVGGSVISERDLALVVREQVRSLRDRGDTF